MPRAALFWVITDDQRAPRPEPCRFTRFLSSITLSIVATVVVATSRSVRRSSQIVLSDVGPWVQRTRRISNSPSVGWGVAGRGMNNSFFFGTQGVQSLGFSHD